MKIRQDIVSTYRDVHSWVGIISALFLFVAFYAGAISMFEESLQNWLSPPVTLPAPPSLEQTPDLLNRVFEAHPEARENYTIVLNDEAAARQGRVRWSPPGRPHARVPVTVAALDEQGELVSGQLPLSEAARFVDELHQQVGLPLPHEPARLVMGLVALLYSVALISGVIAFLPGLTRMLFAVRADGGARKKWLDFHNLLGVFSLPFHIVMALTSVAFAFHDQIFTMEHFLLSKRGAAIVHPQGRGHGQPHMQQVLLPPVAVRDAVQKQAPGFVPETLTYTLMHGQVALRVAGHDDRYSLRGPTAGFATLNPITGHIVSADYLPGHQSTGFAVLTTFFALHFGSFGGTLVRWGYVVLGLGGAFLFYTGNRLWIASRRRRERSTGLMQEARGTWFLQALTTGCPLGCIAGISAVFCAAPFLSYGGGYVTVSAIYYSIFAVFMISGFIMPPSFALRLQLSVAGFITLYIPFAAALASRPVLMSATGGGLSLCAVLVGAALVYAGLRRGRES